MSVPPILPRFVRCSAVPPGPLDALAFPTFGSLVCKALSFHPGPHRLNDAIAARMARNILRNLLARVNLSGFTVLLVEGVTTQPILCRRGPLKTGEPSMDCASGHHHWHSRDSRARGIDQTIVTVAKERRAAERNKEISQF
jgi:hypothetical protein